MMRKLTEDCGSVLMEFIIVMPIYFLLLGFAFVVGELSLHSIHLSAYGDRMMAFTNAGEPESDENQTEADFWRLLGQVLSFDRTAVAQRNKQATDYSYRGDLVFNGRDSVSQFAEKLDPYARKRILPSENGHWTEAVAGRARDNYTLSPVTRGIVAHWFYETERRVHGRAGKEDVMTEKLGRAEKDDIDEILDETKGTLGRAQMKGNYYEDHTGKRIRHYGFFSLRRTKESRVNSYRSQKPAELAGGDWEKASLPSKGDEVAEQTATVKIDPEYYITEAHSRSSQKPEYLTGSGSSDPGVTYEFPDLL